MIPKTGVFHLILFTILLNSLCFGSSPVSHISGLPIIFNYLPSTYAGEPQNWGAVQDSRGMMYFANTEGILEYDGVSWRMIRLPKGETCRSLLTAKDGTLFVAAFNEIGRLLPNSSGNVEYHSLKSKLPPQYNEFSDVWSIAELGGKIYFSTYFHIFIFDGTNITVVNSMKSILSLKSIENKIIVLRKDERPQKLEGSEFVPIASPNSPLPEDLFLSLPSDDNKLLFILKNGSFYKLNNSILEKFSDGISGVLGGKTYYDALRLSNGDIAFATLESGIIITDKTGAVKQILKQETGLGHNTVYSLYEDSEGNLWMMHENGISRINIYSPISIFDHRTGLPGASFSTVFFQNKLFVSTNFGVYTSQLENNSTGKQFEKVSKNISDGWDFLLSRNKLYLASGSGFFLLKDDGESILDSSYCFSAFVPKDDSTIILLATESGLKILQMDPSGERVLKTTLVKGISSQIMKITQLDKGEIWVQVHPGTLRRFIFSDGYNNPPKTVSYERQFLGTGFNPSLFIYQQSIYAATTKGIFGYEAVKDSFVALNSTGFEPAKNLYAMPLVSIMDDKEIALFLEGSIYSLKIDERHKSTTFSQLGRVKSASIYGITSNFFADHREIWLSSTTGLIKYDAKKYAEKGDVHSVIRNVQISDSLYFSGVTDKGISSGIKPGSGVSIDFASLGYQDESNIMYQSKMEGLDTSWTTPIKYSFREFYNIPPGKYIFRVRAILPSGRLATEAYYELKVDSYWYANTFAYILYLIIGTAGVVLFIKYRTADILKERDDLEEMVNERTGELKLANQQLSVKNLQLQKINAQLEKLDREKNEYLGIVAHDLRNPISGIMGFAEIMTDEEEELESEDITRFANNIFNSCSSMLDTLNKLLSMNMVEQGKIDTVTETFDLIVLMNEILIRNKMACDRKKIKIAATLPDQFIIVSDRNFVGQIFDNLISNAIKYSFTGALVDIRLTALDNHAVIEVQDHGQGIPENELPDIFKKFAKISSSPTAGESSAGLGLSIVHMLVQLLKGTIECRSTIGFGTTFTVKLPVNNEEK